MDGAGSYSVAHRAGHLPTELTGTWGWTWGCEQDDPATLRHPKERKVECGEGVFCTVRTCLRCPVREDGSGVGGVYCALCMFTRATGSHCDAQCEVTAACRQPGLGHCPGASSSDSTQSMARAVMASPLFRPTSSLGNAAPSGRLRLPQWTGQTSNANGERRDMRRRSTEEEDCAGSRYIASSRNDLMVPRPRVQRTTKSSTNMAASTSARWRRRSHFINSSSSLIRSQKNTVRTEECVGQGIRWTRGGGVVGPSFVDSQATQILRRILCSHRQSPCTSGARSVCGARAVAESKGLAADIHGDAVAWAVVPRQHSAGAEPNPWTCLFVHPPGHSTAPHGERNHGNATVHDGLACRSV